MPTPMLSTTASLTVQGPSYVPSTARTQTVPTTAATLGGVGALSTQQQARKNLHTTLQNSLVATTVVRPAVTVTSQAVTAVVATAKPTIVTATTTGTVPTAQPTTIIVQASPQLLKQQAQAGQKLVATQVRLPAGVQVKGQTGVVGAQAVQVRLTAPTVTPAQAQQQQQQQQQQPQLPQQQQLQQQPTLTTVAAPAPQQPKKGLSLTVSDAVGDCYESVLNILHSDNNYLCTVEMFCRKRCEYIDNSNQKLQPFDCSYSEKRTKP